jgi:hypothetical protein
VRAYNIIFEHYHLYRLQHLLLQAQWISQKLLIHQWLWHGSHQNQWMEHYGTMMYFMEAQVNDSTWTQMYVIMFQTCISKYWRYKVHLFLIVWWCETHSVLPVVGYSALVQFLCLWVLYPLLFSVICISILLYTQIIFVLFLNYSCIYETVINFPQNCNDKESHRHGICDPCSEVYTHRIMHVILCIPYIVKYWYNRY